MGERMHTAPVGGTELRGCLEIVDRKGRAMEDAWEGPD